MIGGIRETELSDKLIKKINDKADSSDVGDKINLKTVAKENTVSAINEVVDELDTQKLDIGMEVLETDSKTLKGAVNEINNNMLNIRESISRNYYDDYQLWLELYYKGYISQIEAENAKAIIFDGFMDNSKIESGGTVDIKTNLLFPNKSSTSIFKNYSTSNTSYNGTANPIYPLKGYLNNNVNSNNLTTYQILSYIEDYSSENFCYATNFDLGSVKSLSSIDFIWSNNASTTVSLSARFSSCEISIDGVNWSPVSFMNFSMGSSSVNDNISTISHPLSGCYVGRYIRGIIEFSRGYTSSRGGSLCIKLFSIQFNDNTIASNSIILKNKKLSFNSNKAVLYLSSIEVLNNSLLPEVSIDGGLTYNPMKLLNSRKDSKFIGFTEKIYFINSSFNQIKIRFNSIKNASNYSPHIKRYGLILE